MPQEVDAWHYPRPVLVKAILYRFRTQIRRVVHLLAERRMGKTQFLLLDLAPAAKAAGFTVVYASMWGDVNSPHRELLASLRAAKAASKRNRTTAALSDALKTIKAKAALHGAEISAEFDLANRPQAADSGEIQEIKALIDELADEKKAGLLLMIDEVQHLGAKDEFEDFAKGLRTLIDKNKKVHAVLTGSSRSGMAALFEEDKAFHRFSSEEVFEPLDDGFVGHMVERMRFFRKLTKAQIKALQELFERVGRSPFLFRGVVEALILQPSIDIDSAYRRIMDGVALAGRYDDRWRGLSRLDQLVLKAMIKERKLYKKPVLEEFEKELRKTDKGANVSTSHVQRSATRLVDAQIVSPRPGARGLYDVQLIGFTEWLGQLD